MAQTKKERFKQTLATKPSSASEVLERSEGEILHEIALSSIKPDPLNREQTKLSPSNPLLIDAADPSRELKEEFLEYLTTLAESIKAENVKQPIRVYLHGTGYMIAYGECRYLASIMAGKKTIPAIIEKQRPKNLRTLQGLENLQRKNPTSYEIISSINRILEEQKDNFGKQITTASELSKIIHKTERQCSTYMTVIQGPAEVYSSIKLGHLKSLKKAAVLARIENTAERQEALSNVEEGDLTLEDLQGANRKSLEQKKPKPVQKQKLSKPIRGRKRTQVNLGSTKQLDWVKRIVSQLMPAEFISQYDWDNLDAVQKAWDDFLTDSRGQE